MRCVMLLRVTNTSVSLQTNYSANQIDSVVMQKNKSLKQDIILKSMRSSWTAVDFRQTSDGLAKKQETASIAEKSVN